MDPYHSPLHSHGYPVPELAHGRRRFGGPRSRPAGDKRTPKWSVWVVVERLGGWRWRRLRSEPRELPSDVPS